MNISAAALAGSCRHGRHEAFLLKTNADFRPTRNHPRSDNAVMNETLFDPILLTQHMVQTRTVNPPGDELVLATDLKVLLEKLGLHTVVQEVAPDRANLVAWNTGTSGPRLCFTGHLDTVPFGVASWRAAPLSGHLDGDRLYGRGASDMKSGIAAFVSALKRYRDRHETLPCVLVVLTAGEETGCEGAKRLSELDVPPLNVGAMIVGEPTANQCAVGHKGALWLHAHTSGRSAHGAMPELGDNAIYHAVDAIRQLRIFDFETPDDPLLGHPSLNVGTVSGGVNINSVPDAATFSIDIRTVGASHDALVDRLGSYLGQKVRLSASVDVPALTNQLENRWLGYAIETTQAVTGVWTGHTTVAYFSDGPVLRAWLGEVPTVILGPGEPSQAHQTDEWCSVQRILECTDIYFELMSGWGKSVAAGS
ncbi:M20 family metallopeptidase [Burkholderia sp. 22PA0106]|uniref:M20 family metallopeptidase n=1 Tax=Burkholderia sp. 22PA0106 TaxID=3237371 RepID=UPI0039C1A7A7